MIHSNERIIKHKVGLLNLAEQLGNVSKACQVMGLSRDTFYHYKQAVEDGGVKSLLDKDRCKPSFKNRVVEVPEQAVITYAVEQPAHGQHRTSNELRKTGVFVSGLLNCPFRFYESVPACSRFFSTRLSLLQAGNKAQE